MNIRLYFQYALTAGLTILAGCISAIRPQDQGRVCDYEFFPSFGTKSENGELEVYLTYSVKGKEFEKVAICCNACGLVKIWATRSSEEWRLVKSKEGARETLKILEAAAESRELEYYLRAWAYILNSMEEYAEDRSQIGEYRLLSDSEKLDYSINESEHIRRRVMFVKEFRLYANDNIVVMRPYEEVRAHINRAIRVLRKALLDWPVDSSNKGQGATFNIEEKGVL